MLSSPEDPTHALPKDFPKASLWVVVACTLLPLLVGVLGVPLEQEAILQHPGSQAFLLSTLRGALLALHCAALVGVFFASWWARHLLDAVQRAVLRVVLWCCVWFVSGAVVEILAVPAFFGHADGLVHATQVSAVSWFWSRLTQACGFGLLCLAVARSREERPLHWALFIAGSVGLVLGLVGVFVWPNLVLPPTWSLRFLELVPFALFLGLVVFFATRSTQHHAVEQHLWVVLVPLGAAQVHALFAGADPFGHHANSAQSLAVFGALVWCVWIVWFVGSALRVSLSKPAQPKETPTQQTDVLAPPKDLQPRPTHAASTAEFDELRTALKRTKIQLQKTEQRVDAIVRNIPILIFLTDAHGRFVFCDGKVQQLFGHASREVVGRHALTIADSAEDLGRLHHVIRKSLQGEENSTQVDSQGAHFEVRAAPMTDDSGEVLGAVGVVLDVTERVEAEAIRNEFISIVSHELRTPLTSIRGSLGLVTGLGQDGLSKQALKLIEIAESNTMRLIRLVNDLLDLSKLETGKMELFCTSVPIQDAVDEAILAVSGVARRQGVEIKTYVELTCGEVHADKDRLVQILVNLLSNAIKYSHRGGVVDVRVMREDNRFARFEVRDDGPGISKDAQARIFEKFEQADASDTRAKAGTGLGLAIVRSLVDQHGGTLGVHSDPPHGATFFVHIPLSEALSESLKIKRKMARSVLLVRAQYNAGTFDADLEELMRQGFRFEVAKDLKTAAEMNSTGGFRSVLLHEACWSQGPMDLILEMAKTTPIFVRDRSTHSAPHPEVHSLHTSLSTRQAIARISAHLRPPGALRVLVADDDDLIRQLVRTQLSSARVDWLEARDGMEAISLAQKYQPDLIILDVNMPRASGFDLVKVLRGGALNTARVLVHTARDFNTDERDQLRLGRTQFFFKARSEPKEFKHIFNDLIEDLLPLCTEE